jgi:hypothetical protein
MTGRHSLARGRSFIFISIFACMLALSAREPLWAHQEHAKVGPDPQAQVDALRARVDALEHAATPAPWGAWLALGIVGSLLVAAGAAVSVQRERSRRQETITNAMIKLAEKASQETVNNELRDLIGQVRSLFFKV